MAYIITSAFFNNDRNSDNRNTRDDRKYHKMFLVLVNKNPLRPLGISPGRPFYFYIFTIT